MIPRRRRGVVAVIFVVVFVGGGITGGAVYERLSAIRGAEDERAAAARQAAGDARRTLADYMLFRSARPFNIARPGGSAIAPRLLMLPCPDNVEGDNNLDGTQDATCGADSGSKNNITNGVLASGARFGRLPNRQKHSTAVGESEISDGLGGEFRGGGGALWYALSQHFAPSRDGAPLNLHRLDSRGDKWLSVVRFAPGRTPPLLTVNARAAAVVLAPGRSIAGRPQEEFVATASLDLSGVPASLYFESAGGESNADANGVFVRAPPAREFDDYSDYIGMNEMLDADGRFMRDYLVFAGVGAAHNAPAAASPLAEIYAALAEWKNFFGFYPPPAANIAAHLEERRRHCAESRTAESARVSVSELALSAAAETMLSAPSATGTIAATLQADAGFLTAHSATATLVLPLSAVVGDAAEIIAGQITVAPRARLTLFAGTTIFADAALLERVGSSFALPPGATVSLAAAEVFVAKQTPLSFAGMQSGWLPEHHRTTTIIARDGARLKIQAPTAAGFLGGATLTSAAATSVFVSSKARLILEGGIKIEKDFAHLKFLYEDAILHSDNATTTLRQAEQYKPLPSSFARRNFVALLFADLPRGGLTTHAPKVLYPWRDNETTDNVSRDNLHPYPPCFDSRGMTRRARTFIEDHNIYYAVAPGCGDGGACGGAGITVSVAAGAQFAAPLPFTLAHSYTATLRGGEEVAIDRGKAERDLRIDGEFSLPLGAPPAAARLTAGFVFKSGEAIVVPAGAVVSAGSRTQIEDARALLIYSPAPLANTRCLRGMPAPYIAAGATLAAQGGSGADLTTLCQWLDDDENADGDLSFVIRPSAENARVNDYFMLFGGRVVMQ